MQKTCSILQHASMVFMIRSEMQILFKGATRLEMKFNIIVRSFSSSLDIIFIFILKVDAISKKQLK